MWTPQLSLELMDQSGIDTAFLSVSAPGVGMDTPAATAKLARECNEGQTKSVPITRGASGCSPRYLCPMLIQRSVKLFTRSIP